MAGEQAERVEIVEEVSGDLAQITKAAPQKFKDPPLEEVKDGKNRIYRIQRKLGGGGFGVVYVGVRTDGTEDPVAIKFEHIKKHAEGELDPDPDEWTAYDNLHQIDGLPHIHYKGRQDIYYITIMDMLGPSLKDIQKEESERITDQWIIDIGTQAISILKKVHSEGYAHCDIKPHNLLLGCPGTQRENELFLVDLGLATSWRTVYDQQPHRFRGTVEYASVHMHLGRTPSRRDDLESLAYTLISLRDSLPWRENEQDENKRRRYFLVCDKKMSTPPEALCHSLPTCFKGFLEYVLNLKFDEEPDYEGCILLLRSEGSPDRLIPKQQSVQVRTGVPSTQWISVYDARKPMKQRYHYGVDHKHLDRFIKKGKEERLFISSVTSCNNEWALIINDGTGFADQIHKYDNGSLNKAWIEERWNKNYFITAVAGADNGSSLTIMSKGTEYIKQEYKIDDYFPSLWVKKKLDEGFYITSMATIGTNWAIIMSRMDSKLQQVVELDFTYPIEGIHRRWKDGFRMTAIAATANQAAFVFTKSKDSTDKPRRQDTFRTSNFPSAYIKEKWASNFYVTSICYGRTVS